MVNVTVQDSREPRENTFRRESDWPLMWIISIRPIIKDREKSVRGFPESEKDFREKPSLEGNFVRDLRKVCSAPWNSRFTSSNNCEWKHDVKIACSCRNTFDFHLNPPWEWQHQHSLIDDHSSATPEVQQQVLLNYSRTVVTVYCSDSDVRLVKNSPAIRHFH